MGEGGAWFNAPSLAKNCAVNFLPRWYPRAENLMKAKQTLLTGVVMFAIGLPLAAAADAKANWEELCASCHGASGKADTKMGTKLKLKDYSDAKVQAALTDDVIVKATLDGVTIDGKEKMKSYKDKISADDAKAIVGLIRSFKK